MYIEIKNKKGRRHGYWEVKHFLTFNGKPWYKYTYNNGILLGYSELYDANGNGKIHCKQISI